MPKISLQLKLLIFFILIASVPLILVDLVWFNTSRNEAIKTASFEVQRINDQTNKQVKDFFTKQINHLSAFASLDSVINYNSSLPSTDILSLVRQNKEIQELQLLDSNGTNILQVVNGRKLDDNELKSATDTAQLISTVLATDDIYIGDVSLDSDGKPVIMLATTVNTASSTSSRQRFIIAIVKLADFFATFKNLKTAHSVYIVLSDRQGRLLVDHNETGLSLQSSIDEAYVNKLKQHFLGSTDIYHSTHEENGEALIYYSADLLSQWNIISQIPLEGTLSTIRDLEGITIILFLLTLAFVFVTGYFVARNIVKPIGQLKSGSKLIGQGLFNQPINIKSGDEIEELADSFNAMSNKLRETFDKLDNINFELYSQKETASAERNKLSLILSGIHDGVIVVNRNRQVIVFNSAAEKITGRTAQFAIGRNIQDVFRLFDKTTEILPEEYSPIRNDDFEGVTYSKNELKLDAESDKETIINLLAEHITEGRQVGIGCILSLHDVTEKHHLEAMKLDFVSMAAHELRTPLTAIHGYLTLYREENKEKLDTQQTFLLDSLGTAADTLTNLVESLLNVTRIDRGVLVIYPKTMDWVTIVNNVMKDFFVVAFQKKITLKFMPPTQLLSQVAVDPLRIREVLTNLITNALNYTHDGGTVTVTVEQIGNEVITHIEDTGIGIPPEAAPKLFRKFYRVSNEFSSTKQGTGLGLYISKSIVELHHGRIWVTSVLGKGSIFHFALPISNIRTLAA